MNNENNQIGHSDIFANEDRINSHFSLIVPPSIAVGEGRTFFRNDNAMNKHERNKLLIIFNHNFLF